MNNTKHVTINYNFFEKKGGRIFCLSDLHGSWAALVTFLTTVAFNWTKDFCIFLGDAIDRGPDGIKLLEFFRLHQENFLFLMGNHEEFMVESIPYLWSGEGGERGRAVYDCWLSNGGGATLKAFQALPIEEQLELFNWLQNRAYTAELTAGGTKFYFAHAGLTAQWLNESKHGILSCDETGSHNLTWAREEWFNHMENDLGGITITGHSSTHYFGGEYGEPLFNGHSNRIVIDCNTVRSHKVGLVQILRDSFQLDGFACA